MCIRTLLTGKRLLTHLMCRAVDIAVASGDVVTPIMKQLLNDSTVSQAMNDTLIL